MKKILMCITMLGAANAELQPTLSANIGKITSKGSNDSLYWDASVGARNGRFIFEAGYLDTGNFKKTSDVVTLGVAPSNLRGANNNNIGYSQVSGNIVLTEERTYEELPIANELEPTGASFIDPIILENGTVIEPIVYLTDLNPGITIQHDCHYVDFADGVPTADASLVNEPRPSTNQRIFNANYEYEIPDETTDTASTNDSLSHSPFAPYISNIINSQRDRNAAPRGNRSNNTRAVNADTTAEANVKKKTTVTKKISGPKIATGYALPVNQTMDVNFKVGLNWLNNKEVVTTEISRGSDAKEISNETFNTRKLIPSFGVGTSHKLNKSLNLDPGLNCLFLSSFSNQRMKYNNAVNYTLGFTYKI